jgi:hypothetical protein
MKSIITIIFLAFSISINAQITNASFENWANKTITTFGGQPTIPYTYADPVGWTSMNQITANSMFGGVKVVTKSNAQKLSGASSIKVTSTEAIVFGQASVFPGSVISGSFDLEQIGQTDNIMEANGIGQPFTSVPKSLTGFYKFQSQGGDSFEIAAALKSKGKIFATANFSHNISDTNTWRKFDLLFNYITCGTPDTLVIVLSSQSATSPNDPTKGTTLWVDSMGTNTPLGFVPAFPINARNDVASGKSSVAIDIDCSANDSLPACGTATVNSIVKNPLNGTATVLANGKISYKANTNFEGKDSFEYKTCTLMGAVQICDTAKVVVTITKAAAIENQALTDIKIYPNPTSDFIQIESEKVVSVEIYNLNGLKMMEQNINTSNKSINVEALPIGVYSVIIKDENGDMMLYKIVKQ